MSCQALVFDTFWSFGNLLWNMEFFHGWDHVWLDWFLPKIAYKNTSFTPETLAPWSCRKCLYLMLPICNTNISNLGGGNSNMFYFHPEPWGNDPIWLAPIFQMGWFKTTNVSKVDKRRSMHQRIRTSDHFHIPSILVMHFHYRFKKAIRGLYLCESSDARKRQRLWAHDQECLPWFEILKSMDLRWLLDWLQYYLGGNRY